MTTDQLPLTDPRAQRKVAAARAQAIREESAADQAAIRKGMEDQAELMRVRIEGEEQLIARQLDATVTATNELVLAASHQERLRAQELRAAQPADQEDELTMSPARRLWWRRGLLAFTLTVMSLLFGIIVVTQLDFYRQLDGLQPTLLGIPVKVYLAVPVATELLSLLYGAYATFCLYSMRGNYSKYVRWMWIYASIAAVVNASHSMTHLAAGDAGFTALILGGASLASPGAWHAYIGMTLASSRRRSASNGISIIARGRRTIKHPILTRRFHWAVDVFPDMSHDEVWSMIAGAKRTKLANKYAAQIKVTAKPRPTAAAKAETGTKLGRWVRGLTAKTEEAKTVETAKAAKVETAKPSTERAKTEAAKPVETAKVETAKPSTERAKTEDEGEPTQLLPRVMPDFPENWAAIVAEGYRCAVEEMGGVVAGQGKREQLASLVRRVDGLAFGNHLRGDLQKAVKAELERQAAA